MTHLKRLMVAMLVVAVILATGGIAAAAIDDVAGTRFEEAVEYLYDLGVVAGRPDGYHPEEVITRAEAIKMVVVMAGKGDLALLLKGAPSFTDVPGTHWASGYIALAKNMGLVGGYPDGTFHPDEPITYAEFCKLMVEAAGLSPTVGLSWPANYVDAAQKAGMLEDVPDFEAGAPAIRGDCAIMAAWTIQNVEDPATGLTLAQSVFGAALVVTLTLTPATSLVGIGEAVQFTAVAKDDEGVVLADIDLEWGTSDPAKSAVNDQGLFVATAAGTYTVTVEANPTATATVTVYGVAKALKATATRTTIPANAETEVTITVEVVDANGNRVADAKEEVEMTHKEDNGAVTLTGTTKKTTVAGSTTFKVTATDYPEVTDVLQFTSDPLTKATLEISTVEQVPTALDVVADPDELMANEEDEGTVTATVLDQDGEPMQFGVYTLTFAIAGPGYLEDDTHSVSVATAGQEATVDVSSEKGDPGTFTITVTGEGLASGSVPITTYIAGLPKALQVTVNDGKGEAGLADDMKVTVTIVDKFGHPTVSDVAVEVLFDWDDDADFFDFPDPLTIDSGDSRAEVEFYGQTAGTWDIKVDCDDSLTDTSFTCTVVPGDAKVVALTPHLDDYNLLVHVSNPKATFTAEIQDDFGNVVPGAGVGLDFVATNVGLELGDASFLPDDHLHTGADGTATVTLVAQPYVGDEYTVEVTADLDTPDTDITENAVEVADVVPQALVIVTEDVGGHSISRIAADEDNWVYGTITLNDTNGNEVGADYQIEIEFSNDGDNVQTVTDTDDDNHLVEVGDGVWTAATNDDGEVTVEFEGAKAGSFSIKATALEVAPTISKSKSFRTTVGTTAVDVRIFNTDGTLAEDVDYKKETAVQVKAALVDNGNNPIVAAVETTCYLNGVSIPGTAEYRVTSTGTAVTSFKIAAGSTYKTLYYVDSVAGTDVDLYDDATLI